ncbi:hypothetical protein STCU_12344 [Strigomonas culicis]|uniref:Uncharacterized protein n=1 Tax=Strigomonas culicis TaxID=28005 RepID=S9TAW3_9TRYP|nr:hypothetical protein STCU_12344 [Strigomonas culicis]|eukprot:EPY15102.1 hypothetical protein STCU_12344 [Strigomonas culicis]
MRGREPRRYAAPGSKEVHTPVPTCGTESKTFTFSRVQMLLACCVYGTAAIPMSSSDTFEVLSASMFALYLNAFSTAPKDTWNLAGFLKSLDTTWEVGNESNVTALNAIHPGLLNMRFEDILFFKPKGNVGPTGRDTYQRIPFTENKRTNDSLTNQLIEDLQSLKRKQLVVVISTPRSPFADSFIICGNVLFLIQSKQMDTYGQNKTKNREELLKMGLIPDGSIQEHELMKYAVNIEFTYTICKKLKINHVIPVFSVVRKVDESNIHNIKVSLPDVYIIERASKIANSRATVHGVTRMDNTSKEYVYPLTFEPSMDLKATFTRARSGEETNPHRWKYQKEEVVNERHR